jgi:hypothetical protein
MNLTSKLHIEQNRKAIARKESLLFTFGNIVKNYTSTDTIGRMFFSGIIPMAFTDGISGASMIDISDHSAFSSLLGFTEEDLERALRMTGRTDTEDKVQLHLETLKNHFHGHYFHAKQQYGSYNPQACLYYLRSLVDTGSIPSPILDPNISKPSEDMIHFLTRNGMFNKVGQMVHQQLLQLITFLYADLFRETTIESALLSLAYFHGYLTHATGPRVLHITQQGCATLKCSNREFQRIIELGS